MWVGFWSTPTPTQDQHCANLQVGCRLYLSWLLIDHPSPKINTLQILSKLAVHPIWVGCWSTPQDQHCKSLWVGCRPYLSWLLINPPWSTLCRSSLSWLWTLSELTVDRPPKINTLQILSEMAVDPIWVGCWSTPSPPSPPTDVNLSEFTVNRPPSPSPPCWSGPFNRFWAKFFTFQPNQVVVKCKLIYDPGKVLVDSYLHISLTMCFHNIPSLFIQLYEVTSPLRAIINFIIHFVVISAFY